VAYLYISTKIAIYFMYLITLDKTQIPSTPFLWLREEELTGLPIQSIDYNPLSNTYTVSQLSIMPDVNIYICLHSLLFSTLFPGILNIPSTLRLVANFDVNILDSSNITPINTTGPVSIHDAAFSPIGVHCFRLVDYKKNAYLRCQIICQAYRINIGCQFIITSSV
jgi:hypothetical protein